MNAPRRKKIYLSNELQGAFLVRLGWYWVFCLLTILCAAAFLEMCFGPRRPSAAILADVIDHFGPALLGSLLVVPVVILDGCLLSHRVAGPIVRMQRGLKELASGQPVELITLRNRDFLAEVADDFNAAALAVAPSRIKTPPTQRPVESANQPAPPSVAV